MFTRFIKGQIQVSSTSSSHDVDPRRLPALRFGLELDSCACTSTKVRINYLDKLVKTDGKYK